MSDEQEIWERVFIAALTGAACSENGWSRVVVGDKLVQRSEYLLNRAEHLADDAVARIKGRRAALERMKTTRTA